METLFGYDYFAILYTFLLAASLVDESVSKVLRAKWLMALGGIAYCVYLVHLTVFGFASFLAKGPIVALIALALTILVAAVSWKLFEKPFVRLGHRASYSGNCELPTQEAPAMLSASAD
jgi:peptidoglycan/LPS O-acetylase OafA/YrhL